MIIDEIYMLFIIIPMCMGIAVLIKEVIYLYAGDKYQNISSTLILSCINLSLSRIPLETTKLRILLLVITSPIGIFWLIILSFSMTMRYP